MDEVDVIAEQHPLELTGISHYQMNDDNNYDTVTTYTTRVAEPIIIRGAGHITVFALNNRFDEEYPQALHYKVSRDEYRETIKRVNTILRKNVPINFKW